MGEWLERLGYDAECRRKVVSSRLDFVMRRLENSRCQPSSKWVPFLNLERLKQRKKRDGLCLRYSGTLTPPPLRLLGYGKPLPFYCYFYVFSKQKQINLFT